jgi:hypothetical protein
MKKIVIINLGQSGAVVCESGNGNATITHTVNGGTFLMIEFIPIKYLSNGHLPVSCYDCPFFFNCLDVVVYQRNH